MNEIRIIETGFGKKNWNRFTRFPWRVYRNDPHWVPPLLYEQARQLNPRKNPFFHTAETRYWIACREKECVGRIAAIIDRKYNAHYGDDFGFFGFFDTLKDAEAVQALLNTAGDWLKEKGMKKMLGPVNLSSAYECGLLVEGFHRSPFMQMAHNPPHYRELLETNGFEKEVDLLAYYTPATINEDKVIMSRLKRIGDYIMQKEKITFRYFRPERFKEDQEYIRVLFNEFMSENWGFVPVDREEFQFMTASLKQVMVKEMTLFAEVNGKPVGFSVGVPDINQVLKKMNGKLFPFGLIKYLFYKPRISEFRVMLMGVNKEYRKKGLEAVFIHHTISEGARRKFRGAELSWVSEHNTALIRELDFLGSTLHKRYRIFAKPIA